MSNLDIEALLTDIRSTLDLGQQLDLVNDLLRNIRQSLTELEVRRLARTGRLDEILAEACNKFVELKLSEITSSEYEEKFQLIVEGFQWFMETIGHK